MKRWMWILPLAILLAAAVNTSVSGTTHTTETSQWGEFEQTTVEDPVGFLRFAAQCEDALNTVKTTVSTYVNTVVTVAKVIINAVRTVVVAIAKLAVRFAFTLAKAFAHWLIAAVF